MPTQPEKEIKAAQKMRERLFARLTDAILSGREQEAVDLLVQHPRTGDGLVMRYAIDMGSTKIVGLLLDQGMDAEKNSIRRYDDIFTPLQYALHWEQQGVADFLRKREQAQRKNETRAVLEEYLAEKKNNAPLPPEWSLAAPDAILHATQPAGLNSCLKDIFNFTTRERILVTENLSTGVESPAAPVRFDDVSRPVLQQAFDSFLRLGGTADPAQVFRGKLTKLPLF